MSFFDHLDKAKGGFIFLSHSHADIQRIRKIRNCLEENGFEPLCFYLKCLEDSDEIEDLIKREIDAREWFVFANSANSRKSKWVTLEREYIKETGRKKIITIDIDDPATIDASLYYILHNLRVFISHLPKDAALAQRIQAALEEKDYLVYSTCNHTDINTPLDDLGEWRGNTLSAIKLASMEGCVIALMTEGSLKPGFSWMYEEITHAFALGGNVLPVVIGDVQFDDPLMRQIMHSQWYRLSNDPSDEEISELVDRIGQYIADKSPNDAAR